MQRRRTYMSPAVTRRLFCSLRLPSKALSSLCEGYAMTTRSSIKQWRRRTLRLFEIAAVLVRLDHVASIVVRGSLAAFGLSDCYGLTRRRGPKLCLETDTVLVFSPEPLFCEVRGMTSNKESRQKATTAITITPSAPQSTICHVSRCKWTGIIGLNSTASTPKIQSQSTRFFSLAIKAAYAKAAQQIQRSNA